MNRLLHVFWDTDMRCGHDGLASIAKSEGIDASTLGIGNMLCFINRAKNKIKVLAPTTVMESGGGGNIVAYYRSP